MRCKIFKLEQLATIKYGKNQKNVKSDDGTIPIYGTGGLMGFATKFIYDKPSVLIGRKGTINKVRYVDRPFWAVDTTFYTIVNNDIVMTKYLYYMLSLIDLEKYNEGTTIPSLRAETLNKLEFNIPPLSEQEKISSILSLLDDKIELNNRINDNLEQQARAIFDSMFYDSIYGDKTIGEYIIPQRGKSLIAKNAIPGDIPVIAGGTKPAAYHNVANTKPPVITISASGANAGLINIWHIPVWSSDSSFIDYTMTSNVYFWYVMLKKRQNEIFDSQTGSAQPHIYPQNIAAMPVAKLDSEKVKFFTQTVTPFFELIGSNLAQNQTLAQIRDSLLPKLISGELDISGLDL